MTPKKNPSTEEKSLQALEEICENIRSIRRAVSQILERLQLTSRYELAQYAQDQG